MKRKYPNATEGEDTRNKQENEKKEKKTNKYIEEKVLDAGNMRVE